MTFSRWVSNTISNTVVVLVVVAFIALVNDTLTPWQAGFITGFAAGQAITLATGWLLLRNARKVKT